MIAAAKSKHLSNHLITSDPQGRLLVSRSRAAQCSQASMRVVSARRAGPRPSSSLCRARPASVDPMAAELDRIRPSIDTCAGHLPAKAAKLVSSLRHHQPPERAYVLLGVARIPAR
jgi:hypothetical protein